MPLLRPTRRAVLAMGGALALGGRAWAQGAPLTVASRQLEVLGQAATVFGITGPDGQPGLMARAGDRFAGPVLNATDTDLVLHYHGQVLAPWDQDRARPGGGALAPGGSDTVDFALTPGTHWMHSHSLTEQQLLAAPMIAREDDAMADAVIMLHDFAFRPPAEIMAELGGSDMHAAPMDHGDGDAAMDHGAMAGMVHANDITYDAYLANDRTLADPQVIAAEAGQPVRLRIINGATATGFWITTGDLPATVAAVDGNPVQPLTARAFPLAQGQRIDLIVTLPPEGGAFPILARVEAALAQTGVILASPGATIARLPDMAGTEAPHLDLSLDRMLTAATPLPLRTANRAHHLMLGQEAGYRWTINGAIHGEHQPLQASPGERVELMFMNMTMMMHPMHLHGHHFQVVGIGGNRILGPVRDTVIVPPGVDVTVAFDADQAGEWYLHCHHLYHMATGMMTELSVR